jgi:hypothetical protein
VPAECQLRLARAHGRLFELICQVAKLSPLSEAPQAGGDCDRDGPGLDSEAARARKAHRPRARGSPAARAPASGQRTLRLPVPLREPAGASSFKSCFVVCVWSNEVLLVLALADSEARCWH